METDTPQQEEFEKGSRHTYGADADSSKQYGLDGEELSGTTGTRGFIGPHKHWTPGPVDKLRKAMLSIEFQAAVQTAVGAFLVCLLFFPARIRFVSEGITGTIVAVGLFLGSLNPHMGGRTLSAAFLTTLALPVVLAGVAVELAALTGAFELWYSILIAAAWVPLATVRAHDYLQGLLNSVLFAIVSIIAMQARGHALWHGVIWGMVRVAWICAFCTFMAGLLVLASSAREATAKHWAYHARSIGHALSAVSSHLLSPPGDSPEDETRLQAAMLEMTTDAGDIPMLQQQRTAAIDPSTDHSLRHERDPAVRTIGSIRPSLMQSQLLLKTAPFEPPWHCRIQLSRWGPLYSRLEAIATRVSVLESLLESSVYLVRCQHVREAFGVNPRPVLQLLLATISASLAGVSRAIQAASKGSASISPCTVATLAQGPLDKELRELVQTFHTKWKQGDPADSKQPSAFMHIGPARQAVLVVRLQATSLLDDMVGLERLVAEACSSRHSYAWPWNWSLGSQQPDPEMAPTGAGLQGKGSDDKDLDAKLSGIPGGDGKAPSVASPKAQGRSSILKAHVVGELGFIIAYFKIALCLPLVGVIGTVFHESIPKCFGSPSRAWHTIRYNRQFHYGLKFYLMVMGTSIVIINLSYVSSFVKVQKDYFALLALIVTLQERVDAAIMRAVIRILATAVAATLGFAVMWKLDVATNPYGLTAIICAWAAICGTQAFGPFKYAGFLTYMIFNAMVLNQYTGHTRGTISYYTGRVIFYNIGIVLAMLASFVGPWYLAGNAVERLGVAARNAADVGCDIMRAYLEELQKLDEKEASAKAQKSSRPLRSRLATTFRNLQPKVRPEDVHDTEHAAVGLDRLDSEVIASRVANLIGATILQVAMEKVLWKSGMFSMPFSVVMCIKNAQTLLERVAFMSIAAKQPARIRGQYTSAIWHGLFKEFQPQLERHLQAAQAIGSAVRAAVAEHASTADMRALEAANAALTEARRQTDAEYCRIVLDFRKRLGLGDPQPQKVMAAETEDDTMRALSMLLALARLCDKLQLFAGRLLGDKWLSKRNARGFRVHRDLMYVFP